VKAKVQSVGKPTPEPWVREEVDRFAVYLRAEKRSESTVQQYGDTVTGFLEWFDRPPKELSKADMQRWKVHLSEQGYCENTMSTRISAVNQYVERILERSKLKIRPPRRVFRSRIPLTEDEVWRVLAEAKQPREGRKGFPNNADMSLRDHAAICLMYYGGLRTSEVINLRLSDLDLDDRKVRVNQGKGMDFSIVNLSNEAVRAVREYLKYGRPAPSKQEHADCVFLSMRGNRIERGGFWPIVKRIAFRAGIEKNVHPHIFRHSMITHMAEKGLSAPFIQAQSRHKSLDMVARYTHLSQQSVRLAYDSVFSKREPKKCAQTQGTPSESKESGKLELSIDTLRNLLAMLDGRRSEEPTRIEGYA